MAGLRLWLRWSWRDMRARWVQVGAIALVIALGTGTYAGLGSTARWRRASADASYALLGFHDLEVRLARGSFVEQGTLLAVIDRVEPGLVEDAEERLRAPTQVDASTAEETILVPGVIIGVPVSEGGPVIDRLDVVSGRALAAADAGDPVVVLERNFAEYYQLPAEGPMRLSGGRDLRYVGRVSSPEYFVVMDEDGGGFFLQANFAALFTSLETAQDLAGMPEAVNGLVVRLAPGADPEQATEGIRQAFVEAAPRVGVEVIPASEHRCYSVIYQDIENDQRTFTVFAVLILVGAVAAAFNLTARLVEAQRREIGIAMALGVPGRRIALRPLLVGMQIAMLGVAFGVGVGLLLAVAMRGVLEGFFPLPVWITPFQPGVFIGGAAIGFVAPFIATAYPVWRAVRVLPIEAIRPAHLARRVRAPQARRRRGGGNTFRRLPVRNLMRAPRRTILTALGIAAALAVATALLGMIDSFSATIDRGEAEILAGGSDRILVSLDRAYPGDSPEVAAVLGSAPVGHAEASLDLPGRLRRGPVEFDVVVSLADLEGSVWLPSLLEGSFGGAGVVVGRKAADDLGVQPGDMVTLRHPKRTGLFTFDFAETQIEVTGVHAIPYRFTVYVDRSQAGLMSLDGLVNRVSVTPAAGATADDVEQALFGLGAVVSVQPAAVVADTFRDLLDRFIGLLRVVEFAVFVLALAIAFNSASLNLDERARDHATMFAFGISPRIALRLAMVEGALLGTAATVLGLVAGYGIVHWFVSSLFATTAPDIGLLLWVSPRTLGVVLSLGVAAVALAPLLTTRRMRRMDVPGTLRVME